MGENGDCDAQTVKAGIEKQLNVRNFIFIILCVTTKNKN
jgi:hypothetical protein